MPKVVIFSAQPPAELATAQRRINAYAALRKPCPLSDLCAIVERMAG